jgi:thiol-disulfide isomerase/thioredoxin
MTTKLATFVGTLSLLLAAGGASRSATADDRTPGLGVGDHAPCVVLKDIQPDNTEIEQCIRTKPENAKYLLLEFFSVTCSDCQENMPILSKLAYEVSTTSGTRLVAIDRNEAQIRKYLQDTSKTLLHSPVALDIERDAKKAYGVVETPTLFILDKDNQVVFKHSGILSPADVDSIKHLVNQ